MDNKGTRFVKGGIILHGEVKFNNISEAKSFKLKDGKETEPKYDLMLLFDESSEEIAKLESLHKEAIDHELSGIPASKRRSVGVRPLKVEPDVDKNGNETGKLRLVVTRPKKFGAPKLIDNENIEISRKFLRQGSVVRVQVTATGYNVAGSAGMSLRLEGIQLLSEPANVSEATTGRNTAKLVFDAVPGLSSGGSLEESPF